MVHKYALNDQLCDDIPQETDAQEGNPMESPSDSDTVDYLDYFEEKNTGLKNSKKKSSVHSTSPNSPDQKIGKYLAIDCEMVGVGPDGENSALARVSLVNYHGSVILDEFVRPKERVTDFRTSISGIEPHHLKNAKSLYDIQVKLNKLLEGRILIGHAVHNDLECLFLSHPRSKIRDTAYYKPFRKYSNGKTPSLKLLCEKILKKEIQKSNHSSVEDARATMQLYRSFKNEWETAIRRRQHIKVSRVKRRRK